MKFVTVNYHLNQTYSVEDAAILQMIKSAIKDVKGVKLISSKVQVTNDHLGFSIKMEVEKLETKLYEEACNEITKTIEDYSMNLVESKPENIQINFN